MSATNHPFLQSIALPVYEGRYCGKRGLQQHAPLSLGPQGTKVQNGEAW